MRRLASSFALALLAIACLRHAATAQCPLVWSSGGPQRELTGDGQCSTIWDPDGAGPLPSRFVVGGAALVAGDEPLDQRVMTWDGTRWEALGPGPGTSGAVRAMIVWNGALIAAGE